MIKRTEQRIIINHKSYSFKEWCLSDMPSCFGDLHHFLTQWFNSSDVIAVATSGSTGAPKTYEVEKRRMENSAFQTLEFLNLHSGDTALLCMNLKYIGAKMMVVRALVGGLNLVVVEASGNPLHDVVEPIDFAAMVPLQLYNSLQNLHERKSLAAIKHLIVGGGAVHENIQQQIISFDNAIYSTYGMTETLSHIALRRLSGEHATSSYIPFSSVKLSLTQEGCLVIDAPLLLDAPLVTNDIAKIHEDGTFDILGRKDNVINSGGIKIQVEQLEARLSQFMSASPSFVITAVPDDKLGEKVVLICERTLSKRDLKEAIKRLERYHRPKAIYYVDAIPLLENKKVDRIASRKLAFVLSKRS